MKICLTETAWSWKRLLTTITLPGITYLARIPSLLRPDIEHEANFLNRDAENSQINGGWQKQLNSSHLETLMTPNFFTKAWELCGGQKGTTQYKYLPSTIKPYSQSSMTFLPGRRTTFPHCSRKHQWLITFNKGQPNTGWVNALDEMSKVIFMLHDGKFPGVNGLHPKVIERGGWRLLHH